MLRLLTTLLSKPLVTFCCVCCLWLGSVAFHVWAQTNQCTTQNNTPAFRGAGFAWPQNAPVTVNINSAQFSPEEFACIQSAFADYNLANESSGNSSGVYFRLTYTATPIAATIAGTAETAPTPA